MLRNNRFLAKFLNNSHKYWNSDIPSLTFSQIEWRTNNTDSVLGIASKVFGCSANVSFLLKRSDDNYVLFAPSSRKEEGPAFLYDIIDIEEFAKRYPIRIITNSDIMNMDDLSDTLEKIKDKPTKGFIETRKEKITQVFELE